MTKQELMENYTMEQLADMVVEYQKSLLKNQDKISVIVNGITKTYPIEEIGNIVRAYEEIKLCQEQNEECKTMLPAEYLKVLTLNQNIQDKQDEINCLKDQLNRKENIINQIDDILEKLFGVRHDIAKPDEFEKVLKDKIEKIKTLSDFLPVEPMEVAIELINAKRLWGIIRSENKEDIECKYHLYGFEKLRQISKYLTMYCDMNERKKK